MQLKCAVTNRTTASTRTLASCAEAWRDHVGAQGPSLLYPAMAVEMSVFWKFPGCTSTLYTDCVPYFSMVVESRK